MINQHNVGRVINTHEPEVIALTIIEMLNSPQYAIWKNNTIIAAKELNWDIERIKLLEIFSLNN